MGNKNNKDCTPPCFTIENPDKVTGMYLSPNKNILAIGYGNNNIQLYDMESQVILKDFEGCCSSKLDNTIINTAFSPDGSLMAFRWENAIRIMDLSTQEVVRELKNESEIVSISFSPNGNMLLVGGTKDSVSVFDLSKDSSVALIKSVEGRVYQHVQVSKEYHYKQVVEPKWSSDSLYFVTRWNNMARVYKVEYDNVILDIELSHKSKDKAMFTSDDVWDLNFSPDGKYLLVGFNKYEVQLWDFASRSQLKMVRGCVFTGKDYGCIRTAFSPDG
jgi:WD40 repeat protein